MPPSHYWKVSWKPIIHHINVKNRPRINLLGHTVVISGGIISNIPQPRFCHHFTNEGVVPFSILAPSLPAINTPRFPIMMALQHPNNAGCYDPWLWIENQDVLDHHHVEPHRGTGVIPLLSQQLGEPPLFSPCYLEVPTNNIPVTVIKVQHQDEVFKCIHLL